MNKYIVITSIFEPTKAVRLFSKLKDYTVIVVGDKKSPKSYDCENVTFISVDENLGFAIEKKLPFNHYCRKMIGYLYAARNGASCIVDTDDDNIPLENWGFPSFKGNYAIISEGNGFINIYNHFTTQKIWPRGLPLDAIHKKSRLSLQKKEVQVGFWQGLADGDPDVDAIYRLTDNTPCIFDKNIPPIVLDKNTVCPFNTQNTLCHSELFPLLYLPSTVTFRFTDILKGLVAQPLMWNYNYRLGFVTANVFQERNEHDYMKDFESEIPCYLFPQKILDIALETIEPRLSLVDNLFKVYEGLEKKNIVKKEELPILESWIRDIQEIMI